MEKHFKTVVEKSITTKTGQAVIISVSIENVSPKEKIVYELLDSLFSEVKESL